MSYIRDEKFLYFEAYMAGIRWAGSHASSCENMAETIRASLDYARTVSNPPDAAIMTEFGQGVSTVVEGIKEFREQHDTEASESAGGGR